MERSNDILIDEFLFYNEKYPILTQKEIDEMLSLKFFTNKQLQEHLLIIERCVKNDETIIVFTKLSSKFEIDDIKNTKYIYRSLLVGFDLSPEEKYFIENVSFLSETCIFFKTFKDAFDYLITHNLRTEDKFLRNEFSGKVKKYKLFNRERSLHNIYFINEVKEYRINNKNYRLAQINRFNNYYDETPEYKDVRFIYRSVSEEDKDYNLIDEGRVYYETDNHPSESYFFDENTNTYEDGVLLLNIIKYRAIESRISEYFINGVEKPYIITPQIFKFFDKYDYNVKDNSYIPQKQKIILDKYIELLNKNESIKINNILLSKERIEILGEEFIILFRSNFIDVTDINKLYKFHNLIKLREYNLNTFYTEILKISQAESIAELRGYNGETEFTVNDITIKISSKNGVVKINNMRTRKCDIIHILERAICFTNIDDYNTYIKNVNTIGVKWMNTINNGILINLECNYKLVLGYLNTKSDIITIRLGFLRDEIHPQTVYLNINDKKYMIRLKGEFIKHFESNYHYSSFTITRLNSIFKETLIDYKSSILKALINDAFEELIKIKKKGEELILHTIKLTNAIEKINEIYGNEVTGYEITGLKSKRKYFIKKDSLDVYVYVNNAWNRRCVVDSYDKQRIFEDRLANRLVNIYNEPKRIHTIHNI